MASAASTPNSGMPTTPHHDPAADGPARSAMTSALEGLTEYAAPSLSPPSGRRSASASWVGLSFESSVVRCSASMRAWRACTVSTVCSRAPPPEPAPATAPAPASADAAGERARAGMPPWSNIRSNIATATDIRRRVARGAVSETERRARYSTQ